MNDELNLVLKKYPIRNKIWMIHTRLDLSWFSTSRSLYKPPIQHDILLWTDPWNRLFPIRIISAVDTHFDIETTVEGISVYCRVVNDVHISK
jgi:hypothetical protein